MGIIDVDPKFSWNQKELNKLFENKNRGFRKILMCHPETPINAYRDLEPFVGKVYDGSLDVEEFEKFKGFYFGGLMSAAYIVQCTYRERIVESFLCSKYPSDYFQFQNKGIVYKCKSRNPVSFLVKSGCFTDKPTFLLQLECVVEKVE
jgi:hypothetical protein